MADEVDLNVLITELESCFHANLTDDDCKQLFTPFQLPGRLSATEARFTESLGRGDRKEPFVHCIQNLRSSAQNADKFIYFIFQSRKERFMTNQSRTGRVEERTPSRSERAISSPPPPTQDALPLTPAQPSTIGYSASSSSRQRTPLSPMFDRRSASRNRLNGSSSTRGSVLTPGPTPPIQRRIPRPGERRHTELSGSPGIYDATATMSTTATSSATSRRHFSNFNGVLDTPSISRLNINLDDDSQNMVEGVKPHTSNWIQQREQRRTPMRSEYSAINPMFRDEPRHPVKSGMLPPEEDRKIRFVNSQPAARNARVVVLDVILPQLFDTMRGVAGTYFIKNPKGRLVVSDLLSVEHDVRNRLVSVLSVGNCFLSLPNDSCSTPSAQRDIYNAALQPSTYRLRMEYMKEVDMFERKLRAVNHDTALDAMVDFAFKWSCKLQVLSCIWTGLRDRGGHEVIDCLFDEYTRQPPRSIWHCFAREILSDILPFYCRQLSNWILHADIHEHCGKWLISEKRSVDAKDWASRYFLNHVPRRFKFFRDRKLAEKILELGRLVACLGGIHWKGFDYVADKCSQITPAHLYEWSNDGLLGLINDMYKRTGQDVMETLLIRDKLVVHLELSGKMYLQLNESFPLQLFKSLKKMSNNFKGMVSGQESATVLVEAVTQSRIMRGAATGSTKVPVDVMAVVGNTPRDSIRSNYISSLQPKYIGATGLAACVMPVETLTRYLAIFQTIWSLQFAYQAVSHCKYEDMQLDRQLALYKLEGFAPIRRKWSLVLAHLSAILCQLTLYANFVCVDVHERLVSRVKASSDISSVIQRHHEFFDELEEQLFMKKQSVSVCLALVFDTSVSIVQVHERFIEDVQKEMQFSSDLDAETANAIMDDTAAFVRQEKMLLREEKVMEIASKCSTKLNTEYRKFKAAQTSLYEALEEYEDLEPMAGLKNNLWQIMKKIERVGDWTEQISKAGKRYYYNNVTEVSQWDKPDEWKEQERKQEEAQRRDQAMKFAIHNSVVSQPPQPPVLPTHPIYTQQPYTAPPPPFASHPPPPMNIHHPPPPPSMLIPPYSPAFPPHVPPMNAAMNPVNFMVPPPPVSSVPAPIHGSSSSQHGTPLSSGHNAMDRDRERDREAHSSHQRDYAPRRSSDKPPCISVSTPHTSQPSSQMHLQRQDSGQQYGHSGQQSNAPHQHHYSSHSHSHHISQQQHQQYQQHGSQPHSSQHRTELNRADSRSSTHSSPAPVDPEIRSRKRPEERSEERPNKVQRRDSGVAEVKSGIDNRNHQSSPHNDKHGGSQPMDIDEEKADSNMSPVVESPPPHEPTVNFSKYYDKGLAEKGWKMMQLENLTLSMKKINSARIDAADILAESTETVVRLYSAISMTTTCELRRRIYDDKIKCNRDFQKWLDTRMKNGGGSTGSAIASASALNSSFTNNS